MKLKIIDSRRSIIDKCEDSGYDVTHGDYFTEILKVPRHVICSASNSSYTFGGGFDRELYENFPLYCQEKQTRIGSNERIGNICFVISVDNELKANERLVREALQFSKENTAKDETLCIMGIGTAIGRLDESQFVSILKEVFPLK